MMTVKNAYLANEECLNALPELVKTFDGLILSEATLLTSDLLRAAYRLVGQYKLKPVGMKIYLITLTPWPRKVITLALIPAMGPV
jgi:hypothetical protein